MEGEQHNHDQKKVVFFDGVCGLCNSFVDFIIKRDKKKVFLFSPLQSDFAAKNLSSHQVKNLNTLVVMIDGATYVESDAVLKVLENMPLPWLFLKVFKILPKFLRDFFYKRVAGIRYKLFGKKDTCRMPRADERKRFIL